MKASVADDTPHRSPRAASVSFTARSATLLQEDDGQITPAHSISAGLDYPGVGPEHSYYRETGRAEYVPVTDAEAVEGFQLLSETEGIIPALESAHAIAYLRELAPKLGKEKVIVVCLSGRGDKDVYTIAKELGISL